MWHIMLCGLLALPASVELGSLENLQKPVLTEQSCESCATCAKCAKNKVREERTADNCAKNMREVREVREERARHRRCGLHLTIWRRR